MSLNDFPSTLQEEEGMLENATMFLKALISGNSSNGSRQSAIPKTARRTRSMQTESTRETFSYEFIQEQPLIGLSLGYAEFSKRSSELIAKVASLHQFVHLDFSSAFAGTVSIENILQGLRRTMQDEGRPSSLIFLGLNNNLIGHRTAPLLCSIIAESESLTALDVGSNKFTDDSALLFARALKKSKTITSLDISRNPIEEKGLQALLSAARVNSIILNYGPLPQECVDPDTRDKVQDRLALNRQELSEDGLEPAQIAPGDLLFDDTELRSFYIPPDNTQMDSVVRARASHTPLTEKLLPEKWRIAVEFVNTICGAVEVRLFAAMREASYLPASQPPQETSDSFEALSNTGEDRYLNFRHLQRTTPSSLSHSVPFKWRLVRERRGKKSVVAEGQCHDRLKAPELLLIHIRSSEWEAGDTHLFCFTPMEKSRSARVFLIASYKVAVLAIADQASSFITTVPLVYAGFCPNNNENSVL